MAFPLQSGLDAVVDRYAGLGPFLASFLANTLATFGDKGQLVVITLATRYSAKRVFAGAVAAFAAWSALEVALGQWIQAALPAGVITLVTGLLFVGFALWTAVSAARSLRADDGEGAALTSGGIDVGLTGRLLPERSYRHFGAHGGLFTAFVFIGFAEFGDKTQLLTINLAATFPDAPVAVFAGVLSALALRTGIDAVIGGRIERHVPTERIELGAAVVFLAFGLTVLGVVPQAALLAVLGALALALVAGLVRSFRRN
ncbi:hypothetical protein K933_04846 [Candidatus Halobonum tyrrellensis G22]|uniref:Transmembrane protein n=1 Tax=Candidatus Halobonum tyrrellensis G22 TaxID=1324957 RepID=V4J1N3_9EURY|nr:hypothetical protein K933_04846 [Candidatus Halobonum tyrrellensis G22]